MKPSKNRPKKRVQPAARSQREPVRKSKAVLTMPITRPAEVDNHAARIEAHRKQMDSIQEAYRESTAAVFNEPISLADRQTKIRKNMRQLAKALGDWHCAALELLDVGQREALLQMLPDLKGGRWSN